MCAIHEYYGRIFLESIGGARQAVLPIPLVIMLLPYGYKPFVMSCHWLRFGSTEVAYCGSYSIAFFVHTKLLISLSSNFSAYVQPYVNNYLCVDKLLIL